MTFIFIGRGGRTPSKSSYKRTLQIRSNLIQITQCTLPILAANTNFPPGHDRLIWHGSIFYATKSHLGLVLSITIIQKSKEHGSSSPGQPWPIQCPLLGSEILDFIQGSCCVHRSGTGTCSDDTITSGCCVLSYL